MNMLRNTMILYQTLLLFFPVTSGYCLLILTICSDDFRGGTKQKQVGISAQHTSALWCCLVYPQRFFALISEFWGGQFFTLSLQKIHLVVLVIWQVFKYTFSHPVFFVFFLNLLQANGCWWGHRCFRPRQFVSCWLATDHLRAHAAEHGCRRLAFSTDSCQMTVFTRGRRSLKPLLAPTATTPYLSRLLKYWCGATRVIIGHSRLVVFAKLHRGSWEQT